MRSSLKFTNKLKMLSEMECDSKFQILEYENLDGAADVQTAFGLNIIRQGGIKLKQVRIMMDNSSVKLEPGVFSYMKGNIEVISKSGGILGFGKKVIASKLTGENAFKPTYSGTGEIFLEPSFGHFALIELEDDEIILSDSMFYACEDGIEVDVAIQKNVSAAFLGNEGLYQTRLEGSGIVTIKVPVPESEIFKCILINDTLKVDGNLAILRTGNIDFSVEKSSKSIAGTVISGEGIINVYRGTGEVWLVPTKSVYSNLKMKKENKINKFKPEMENESDI